MCILSKQLSWHAGLGRPGLRGIPVQSYSSAFSYDQWKPFNMALRNLHATNAHRFNFEAHHEALSLIEAASEYGRADSEMLLLR